VAACVAGARTTVAAMVVSAAADNAANRRKPVARVADRGRTSSVAAADLAPACRAVVGVLMIEEAMNRRRRGASCRGAVPWRCRRVSGADGYPWGTGCEFTRRYEDRGIVGFLLS
jgi:hypothetical protein